MFDERDTVMSPATWTSLDDDTRFSTVFPRTIDKLPSTDVVHVVPPSQNMQWDVGANISDVVRTHVTLFKVGDIVMFSAEPAEVVVQSGVVVVDDTNATQLVTELFTIAAPATKSDITDMFVCTRRLPDTYESPETPSPDAHSVPRASAAECTYASLSNVALPPSWNVPVTVVLWATVTSEDTRASHRTSAFCTTKRLHVMLAATLDHIRLPSIVVVIEEDVPPPDDVVGMVSVPSIEHTFAASEFGIERSHDRPTLFVLQTPVVHVVHSISLDVPGVGKMSPTKVLQSVTITSNAAPSDTVMF